MRPTWYDTLKYWNGKEILRECKDKNRLCVHANVWNTCVDKPCEKGDPMTNREWLESLSDEEFAKYICYVNCEKYCAYYNNIDECRHNSCKAGITEWLQEEHKEPTKELTQAQLCEAFELKFRGRRVITLDEIRGATKEIFK